MGVSNNKEPQYRPQIVGLLEEGHPEKDPNLQKQPNFYIRITVKHLIEKYGFLFHNKQDQAPNRKYGPQHTRSRISDVSY